MIAINSYFRVYYNGKNITEDVSENILDIDFTDKLTGESDELEISLEDMNERWSDSWYPEKGATLSVSIGYSPEESIRSLEFRIDEIGLSFSSDGSKVTIKGVGAGIVNKLKTKRSYAHENKTLSEIVHTIAAKYGYTVVGSIAPITISRVTQKREKDITFLQRLADEYGYIFNIKGNKLIFTPIKSVDEIPHVLSIDRTDCVSIQITDKSLEIYNQVVVKHHNPNEKKVVSATYNINQEGNVNLKYPASLKDGNDEEIRTKTENEQQARAKAEGTLYRKNSLQQTASIELPGNVLLLAGNNIEITGIGACSGIWNILEAKHKLSSEGYTTSCELKKVVPFSLSGSKKTPKAVSYKSAKYSTK